MADIKLTFQNEKATINIAPKPQASVVVDSTQEADKIIINYPTNINPDVIINNPEEQVKVDMTPRTNGFVITYPEPGGTAYVHPDTHPAAMVVETETRQFITETERNNWNTTAERDTFVFDQMVSASSWVINHSLNKYPAITVVDTGNNTVIGEVAYITLNRVDISFSAPFSGKAYLT